MGEIEVGSDGGEMSDEPRGRKFPSLKPHEANPATKMKERRY